MPSFAPSSFLSEFSRDLYAFIIRTFIYIAIDCLSISLSATLYRFWLGPSALALGRL